jgi:hypothetical protein
MEKVDVILNERSVTNVDTGKTKRMKMVRIKQKNSLLLKNVTG